MCLIMQWDGERGGSLNVRLMWGTRWIGSVMGDILLSDRLLGFRCTCMHGHAGHGQPPAAMLTRLSHHLLPAAWLPAGYLPFFQSAGAL
jgi:hypothetical protein